MMIFIFILEPYFISTRVNVVNNVIYYLNYNIDCHPTM